MENKICKACGNELPQEASFCMGCGELLKQPQNEQVDWLNTPTETQVNGQVFPRFETPGADNSVNANGFGNLSSYGSFTSAAAVKRNYTPLIAVLIVLALAAAAVYGYFHFFGGSSYERAERSALRSASNSLNNAINTDDQSVDISFKVTPGAAMLTEFGLPDLGSFTLSMDTVVENAEIYMLYGLDGLGLSLSAALWMIEEQMLLHLPGLSEYYILLNEITGTESAMIDSAEVEKLIKELGKVMNKALDKYFALTKDVKSSGSEEISLGGITQNADVYVITLDGKLLIEIVKATLEALLDSDELMKIGEDNYSAIRALDPWMFVQQRDFRSLVRFLLSELEDVPAEITETSLGKMNVFISGRNVVKREFVFGSFDTTEVRITHTDLKKGNDYAESIVLTFADRWSRGRIEVINTGSERGGARSGSAEMKIIIDDVDLSLIAVYSDLSTDKNGLSSGKIDITVPIPAEYMAVMAGGMSAFTEAEIKIRTDSSVTGNRQTTNASVTFLGMRLIDMETTITINTGKKIPSVSDIGKIINANDIWAMSEFMEDVMSALEAMIADNDILGGLMGAFSGFTVPGISGDLDFFIDPQFADDGIDISVSNGVFDYGDYDDYDTAYFRLIGNLWKALLGNQWSDSAWLDMVHTYGSFYIIWYWDMVSEWAGAWDSVGLNVDAAILERFLEVVYDYDYRTDEFWLNFYVWDDADWENYWRSILANI
jgi:hypothetical protein